MAKYIRIMNQGSFDVISAVNMIGASVKTTIDPIGMFGSGTKYALAQCVREGIQAKIFDGANLWNVKGTAKEFRGTTFSMITLQITNGRKVVTPITTDFGHIDWKDDWFIFREFVSNARDEGTAMIDIVDGLNPVPNTTAIYLPYERFKTYYDNLSDYFCDEDKRGKVWLGSGRMFKRGVYCGTIEGCKLNFESTSIRINECRVMDSYDAMTELTWAIRDCNDYTLWLALFMSSDKFREDTHGCTIEKADTLTAMHHALNTVYGENYCVCPKVNSIIADATALGMIPVVLPSRMVLQDTDNIVRQYLSMADTNVVREMNETEYAAICRVMKKLECITPVGLELDVKVFSEGVEGILGDAKLGTNQIRLRDTEFNDERKLCHTLLHEIGHIVTGAGDYDRKFTEWFISALVEICY